MPGNAFSAPGPYCMANTAGGRPLAVRAKPLAMSTPTRSWRQMIGRRPAATAASMMGVVGKQNSVEIPSRVRMCAIASITSMTSPLIPAPCEDIANIERQLRPRAPRVRGRNRSRSHVNPGKLVMRPFDRGLGRHALNGLRVHVGDDVFGHHLGGLAIGWAGVSRQAPS